MPCATLSMPAAATGVAFAPRAAGAGDDGSRTSHLAVGLDDGGVQIWRVALPSSSAESSAAASECVWQASVFQAHAAAVRRLRWRMHGSGAQLATCSEDHAVKLFEVELT